MALSIETAAPRTNEPDLDKLNGRRGARDIRRHCIKNDPTSFKEA